jgi:diadenosine tetraphosphate (Ap4A) HIT family hydrolase
MNDRIIEDYQGQKHTVKCIGCFYNTGGKNVPGYVIATEFFHAHQDHEIPIPGFVILSTRRHVESFDQFTDAEAAEFIKLVKKIRLAQRQVLGIQKAYFIQEEDTEDHFHLWILPRYDWMNDIAKFGRKISSARPVLEYARAHLKTPDNIIEVNSAAAKLSRALVE